VIFAGALPHDEVPAIIRQFDVALAPYPKLGHAFYFSPLKLLEYMACGVAVVAAECGQIAEVIRHGKTGFLVPADDVVDAAQRVRQVAMISRADCRRHAEANLNLEATLTAHERLYHQLRSRTRAKSHG